MSGIMTRANITEAFEFASLNTQYAGPVQMIAFHPENTWLACATYDQLFLWDIQRRRLRFQAQMNVQALAFQPDGAALVVASADILFLSLPEGEVQNSLKGHPQGTTCLDLARRDDDILLASGGMDGVVRIGNLNTRRLVHKLAHDAPVRQIAFSPDGTLLAALSWGDEGRPRGAYVWDVQTGVLQNTLSISREKNLAFSSDGAWLALDGKVFEIANQRVVYDLNEQQVIFSPNGELMATSRGTFPSVGLWDTATGDQVTTLRGHDEPVRSLAFNAQGTLLASGAGNLSALRSDSAETGELRLWTVPKPEKSADAPRVTKPLKQLGTSDDDDDDDTLLKNLFGRFSR
jgi:WD40 repeat protein